MVNYVQAQDEDSMVTEKSGKAIKRINYDYDFTRIIKRSNLNYILDTNNKVAKVYQYDQGEKDNPYQYAYTGDINILATITYNKETYSVIAIDEHAFAYCTGLNSVIIPEGVTQIGQYAFKDCSNMTNIILPNNLTNIGEEAFNGCSSLTKINIPKSMTTINKWAFSGCGLTSVDIPDHVMKINDYPLAELNQRVLNPSNGLIVNVVNVLQCGQRTHFANDSGKQTACFYRIVSYDKELFCKL